MVYTLYVSSPVMFTGLAVSVRSRSINDLPDLGIGEEYHLRYTTYCKLDQPPLRLVSV